MPNVLSETSIETDAFGNLLAPFLLLLRLLLLTRRLPFKNASRTAKHRGSEGRGRPKKSVQRVPNVPSENREKKEEKNNNKKNHLRTAKQTGLEGRTNPESERKTCLTSLLKPREKRRRRTETIYLLLLLLACQCSSSTEW